jgi:hypothetical protein
MITKEKTKDAIISRTKTAVIIPLRTFKTTFSDSINQKNLFNRAIPKTAAYKNTKYLAVAFHSYFNNFPNI